MKKMHLRIILIFILVLAILFIVRFISGEDVWLCQNGEWIKHGKPRADKPTELCGEVKEAAREKAQNDFVVVDYPLVSGEIDSPLVIKGRARGGWYFEASFPVVLVDWDGLIIAQGIAQAQGDWMTNEFVPFEAKLEFTKPTYKNNGALILKKDNPSGLPENDDALEFAVIFK